ncbi:MAG: hypothetical protein ACI4RD_01745 [Kiritimatiellia bacterium]
MRYGSMVVGVAATMLAHGLALASAETDWSVLTGAVTIPDGETWVADEDDMTAVNALDSVTLADTATLVFRATVTVPKAGLLNGSGAVRKTGTTDWKVSAAQSGFIGDFHIDAGAVTLAGANALGLALQVEPCGDICVHDGGSLIIDGADVNFYQRGIRLAGFGTGAAGSYALDVRACGAYGRGVWEIVLDADASLSPSTSVSYWISPGYGVIDLQSYDLYRYGTESWYLRGLTVKGSGRMIFKGGYNIFTLDASDLGTTEDGPLVVDAGSGVTSSLGLGAGITPIFRPLLCKNSVNLNCVSGSAAKPMLGIDGSDYAFTGGVTLAGEGTVLAPTLWDNENGSWIRALQYDFGPIAGEGSLFVGDRGANSRLGRVYLRERNTHTGTTTVNGAGNVGLLLGYPGSIPDWSKVTLTNNAYLAARLGVDGEGNPRWTPSDIYAAINGVSWTDAGEWAHFSIDASECENGVYTLDPQDVADNVPAGKPRTIGVAGGVLRLLAPAGETRDVTLAADHGRLELTGGGRFYLVGNSELRGLVHPDNPYEGPLATVCVQDGSTVVQGDETVFVGGSSLPTSTGWDIRNAARLVVTNAAWRTTCDTVATDLVSRAEGVIWVGCHNLGVLEVQRDAVVSNRVIVGGGRTSYSAGEGAGAVYVNGGSLNIVQSGQSHLSSVIGSYKYGYLELTAGEVVSDWNLYVGQYGYGCINAYGGSGTVKNILGVACGRNHHCNFNLLGGSWTVKDFRVAYDCNVPNQAEVTVADGGYLKAGAFYGPREPVCTVRLNLIDGGVLETPGVFGGATSYPDDNPHAFIVNFDGGVLRSSGTGANSLFAWLANGRRVSDVCVYGQGAVIDTPSGAVQQHSDTPFAANVAGGVQAIRLPKEYTGLIGAPEVVIDNLEGGTGVGATATADWDPATRTLRGVRITSPGWGYAQESVRVTITCPNSIDQMKMTSYYNLKCVVTNNVCKWDNCDPIELPGAIVVGDNTIGGLTKRGAATLTLNATNEWRQWTSVEGGKLVAGSSGAIPDGTVLKLSGGGVLDFNGHAVVVDSVEYGVGGGSYVNADNVVFTSAAARKIVIDIDDLLAGKTVPFDVVDLAEMTVRVTGDLTKLDPEVSSHYRFVTASSASGTPTFETDVPLPAGWSFKTDGAGVRLSASRGLILIIR